MKFQSYFNNFFWLFLTYLLAPFFYLLLAFKKKNAELKILVIQTAKIGDLVCTTPVFREIKKKFPSCFLTVIVNSKTKDVLKNNPRVDKIILLDDYPGIGGKFKLFGKLRKENYDWVISVFPSSFNSIIGFWSLIPRRITATHRQTGEIAKLYSVFNNYRLKYQRHDSVQKHHLALLSFMGIEAVSEEKEMFVRPEEEKKVLNFLGQHNLSADDLLIGVSVTSGLKIKEWERSQFSALSDKLIQDLGAKIIFIGGAGDQKVIEEIQKMMKNNAICAAGLFRLNELAALFKKMKLFISVDSGPLYIADAVGTPVIDIFGPSDIKEVHPTGAKCRILRKDISCAPCSFMFEGPRFCKEGHSKCLKEITTEDVFNAARDLIK